MSAGDYQPAWGSYLKDERKKLMDGLFLLGY